MDDAQPARLESVSPATGDVLGSVRITPPKEVAAAVEGAAGAQRLWRSLRIADRARYMQRIGPWALTEYDEEGEAIVHGYCDGSDTEVLFELQNLTEVGAAGFRAKALHVGLCGLAYRARVCAREMNSHWLPLEQSAPSRAAHENDWSLRGQVLAFKPLRNPLSGSELYWIYLDLGKLRLEVLVNARALSGGKLEVGATLSAEVWLQGHLLDEQALQLRYEGVDTSFSMTSFWSLLSRSN